MGRASGERATFADGATIGQGKTLASPVVVGEAFGPDPTYLLELVAHGQLVVDIGRRGSWQRFDSGIAAFEDGKAIGRILFDVD